MRYLTISPKMGSFFGLEKMGYLLRIVKETGGLKASFLKLFRMDEVKIGTLIGTDKYGNKYFENNRFFYGRNRWVEYSPKYGFDYDGSQISADWYGWMHYKTDLPPHKDPSRPKHAWMLDHTENTSGTNDAYMPYSTTTPKIEPWIPPPAKK